MKFLLKISIVTIAFFALQMSCADAKEWDTLKGNNFIVYYRAEVPEDFVAEISKNKKAHDFFKTLNKTNLYTIGWRLQTATNPLIRAKRINEMIEKLGKEEKFH